MLKAALSQSQLRVEGLLRNRHVPQALTCKAYALNFPQTRYPNSCNPPYSATLYKVL